MLVETTASDIIEQFERGEAPGVSFHHADHVHMAFVYLERYPFLEAVERFCSALQRFAAAQGKPGLYHETITWAFLFLIRERRARAGKQAWEEFRAANEDLLVWKEGIVYRMYGQEVLQCELARKMFVLPHRGQQQQTSAAQAGHRSA